MVEKHFPSPISVGDFFGDAWIVSVAVATFDVSLFSFESTSTSRLSSDDCDVDSSDDSAMFSRSLLSQSYMCARGEKRNEGEKRKVSELLGESFGESKKEETLLSKNQRLNDKKFVKTSKLFGTKVLANVKHSPVDD